MNQFYQDANGQVIAKIDGWRIETFETNMCGLAQGITSPSGRQARACYIGIDGRLSALRTSANIEFASLTLKLSDALVDRMILAAEDYADRQARVEPEFSLTKI